MKARSLLAAAALPLLLAVSLVSAQTETTCKDADTNNARVKASCTGQIIESRDANRCVWLKCAPSETNLCADADVNNARVKASCAGTIVQSWDANKCLWLKCDAVTQTTENPCREADAQNAKVKASCTGKIIEGRDANRCLWLKCDNSTPLSACMELRIKLGKLTPDSPDYAKLKLMYLERCGDQASSTSTSTSTSSGPVDCRKTGCKVACSDGTSYNVCLCEGGVRPPVQANNCTRKKDEATGCVIVTCGDQVKRECPSSSSSSTPNTTGLRCETQRIGSCIIKKCNDGTVTRECKKL